MNTLQQVEERAAEIRKKWFARDIPRSIKDELMNDFDEIVRSAHIGNEGEPG